jgi:hypothetical protein
VPVATAPPRPSRAAAQGAPLLGFMAGWVRMAFPRRQAANTLPGRGYPMEPGAPNFLPAVGGARGPAAIPGRGVFSPPTPGVATAGGAYGPSPITRREPVVVQPGRSPGLQNTVYDNGLLHSSIAWSRPRYENADGLNTYRPPTQQPNWTYDSALQAMIPLVPVPVQEKSIANFTVRKPFGDTSTGELSDASYGKPPGVPIALPYYGTPGSPTYPTPSWMVRRPASGGRQQRRRWAAQAKTRSPLVVNLTRWGQAGSYGQTTTVLSTAPSNVPAPSGSAFGSY